MLVDGFAFFNKIKYEGDYLKLRNNERFKCFLWDTISLRSKLLKSILYKPTLFSSLFTDLYALKFGRFLALFCCPIAECNSNTHNLMEHTFKLIHDFSRSSAQWQSPIQRHHGREAWRRKMLSSWWPGSRDWKWDPRSCLWPPQKWILLSSYQSCQADTIQHNCHIPLRG